MVMLNNIEHCYSIFSENDLLTPVTPNDHILTFDPITQVEGHKLINMY